ncbi:MAG: hypothetical protein ABI120_26170 [Gemmatimonadaceae bacterium]
MFPERVIRVRFSMPSIVTALLLFVIATGSAHSLVAQGSDTAQSRGDNRRPGGGNRAMVERTDEFIDKILRERLQLTDDQSVKLRALGRKMDIARLALRKDERDFRESLRQELLPGVTPDEAKVSALMSRWPLLERKRIALQEHEQKEMATFLQPVQRARFFALQDEMRRMMQEAQWRRGDKDRGDGRGKMMRSDSTGGRPPYRGGPGGRGGRIPPRDTTKPPQ